MPGRENKVRCCFGSGGIWLMWFLSPFPWCGCFLNNFIRRLELDLSLLLLCWWVLTNDVVVVDTGELFPLFLPFSGSHS